jgi:hypothetical protein
LSDATSPQGWFVWDLAPYTSYDNLQIGTQDFFTDGLVQYVKDNVTHLLGDRFLVDRFTFKLLSFPDFLPEAYIGTLRVRPFLHVSLKKIARA